MAFEVEHDWQGNLATPRAKIGERAKTRLLILLCVFWVCLGLIGHAPWKPDEAQSVSIVKSILDQGNWIAPVVVGQSSIENPPLYYLTAAAFAKALSPILYMHDAARLASGLWMAFTLLLVGMTGRELWGVGSGRQTTFIFISSLGLIVSAHVLMPDIAALTGTAMGLYALALAKRRPFRASALLGSGIGISFLSTGLLDVSITLITALSLPIFFSHWRTRSYGTVLAISAIVASPWLFIWPALCWYTSPSMFNDWWQISIDGFGHLNQYSFLKTLAWYAWPGLPLAIWGLWRFRNSVLHKPKFQLLISFFVGGLLIIGFGPSTREIYALPMLLPITVLAAGSVETLKRGAASALNWFGLILFAIIGILIWLGWFAMMTGWPATLSRRMKILSATPEPHLSILALAAGLVATIIWLLVVINAKRSNRAAITDWAVGITMAWTLLMTLWLPWIDHAKTYEHVVAEIKQALPNHYDCIISHDVSEPQLALLHYYANIKTEINQNNSQLNCDFYLIQDDRDRNKYQPGEEWMQVWQGKRPTDRRESFRLYKKQPD
jgi:4-amino-4-deoxy-L-arabinose transferase-like glycosyltransferase